MPILDTSLHSLKRIYRGKVRDSYELDDDKLLIIATDRISAFDVILDDPIPYKGMVLQALTDFWFEKLKGIVPNHLTGIDPTTVVAEDEVDQVKGRSVVAMKLKPIPIECVVRGYIAGGGWKDYQATGKVIADTKFEFGLDKDAVVRLMDEVLTPDSSRFWPADQYNEGISPPSFDKQFVRDWLETQPWNKTAPAPRAPQEILEKTSQKYREALRRLAGRDVA